MVKYFLMHKDNTCGVLSYDDITGRIVNYRDFRTGESPFLGNSDDSKIKRWWEFRSVPASRTVLKDMLREAGCLNAGGYLAKNLALSMTDAYWIRPEGVALSYRDINFSNLSLYHDGKIPYHNAASYDPNASLGGQMEKYWDLSQTPPVLVKESTKYFGQQSINEVFASKIHELQNSDIPFVKYTASVTEDRTVLCRCKAFTSETVEFIPAYEVVESQKNKNDVSLYDGYIDICIQNGIDREIMQRFMDYQTLTDFIISNTDEHLLNFGILRDSDTMKLLGPAPIFDSGNSMFFSEERKYPYSRAGLLERKITSFYDKEEAMLKRVRNKNIVKVSLLPEPEEVKRLYAESGIPEWKADVISKNYGTKLQMLLEFQRGKTISLYAERRHEQETRKEKYKTDSHDAKFIMLCGIPGSGKTAAAKSIESSLNACGYKTVTSRVFYPVDKALSVCHTGLLVNENLMESDIVPKDEYKGSVTVISPSDIWKELPEQAEHYDNNFVFAIVKARIKTALLSGATVIYIALNITKEIREHYIGIAESCNIKNKELYVMKVEPERAASDLPLEKLNRLDEKLKEDWPNYSEGWNVINICESGMKKEF